MNDNFKNYIDLIDNVEKYGAIVLEYFSWTKPIAASLPNIDLDLPQIQKQAKIDLILDKKNPIYIQLSDGSKLFFTYDEYKRIEGKPERGKTMIITMQRLGHDTSNLPSQITKCKVI